MAMLVYQRVVDGAHNFNRPLKIHRPSWKACRGGGSDGSDGSEAIHSWPSNRVPKIEATGGVRFVMCVYPLVMSNIAIENGD